MARARHTDGLGGADTLVVSRLASGRFETYSPCRRGVPDVARQLIDAGAALALSCGEDPRGMAEDACRRAVEAGEADG